MRNVLPAFILIILLSSATYGQFENWDFEQWEIVNGEEVPVNWITNQDSTRLRIMKTDHCFQGDYCMQMIANAPGHFDGCYATATTNVKLDNPTSGKDSLTFAFRIFPSPGSTSVYFLTRIWGFKNGQVQSPIIWQQNERVNEFEKVSIHLKDIGVDSLVIEFFNGGLANGMDECVNKCQSWIDDMKFVSGLTSSIKENNLEYKIFPNPSEGTVNISHSSQADLDYELFDTQGRLKESGKVSSKIELSHKGIYYLRLSNGITSEIQKIIIQ